MLPSAIEDVTPEAPARAVAFVGHDAGDGPGAGNGAGGGALGEPVGVAGGVVGAPVGPGEGTVEDAPGGGVSEAISPPHPPRADATPPRARVAEKKAKQEKLVVRIRDLQEGFADGLDRARGFRRKK
jgi:hypothetical protein